MTEATKSPSADGVLTSPKSPWQNACAERVIGSIRRAFTDRVIPIGEKHLLRVLREYVDDYNTARTHQGQDGDAPVPRERLAATVGHVVTESALVGLRHLNRRAA